MRLLLGHSYQTSVTRIISDAMRIYITPRIKLEATSLRIGHTPFYKAMVLLSVTKR